VAKVASSLNLASLRVASFSRRLQDDHSWNRQIFIVGLLAITKSPGGGGRDAAYKMPQSASSKICVAFRKLRGRQPTATFRDRLQRPHRDLKDDMPGIA
jgi:hypothetical protein